MPSSSQNPSPDNRTSVSESAVRSLIKGAVANALDGHRDDPSLATRITDSVTAVLAEVKQGGAK